MVKFGKNKFKALNKSAKTAKNVAESPGVSNKILKKKINLEKKVTFQKEVLKTLVSEDNTLVKNVTVKNILNESKKAKKSKPKVQEKVAKPKTKSVEKKKKRQRTQINDTKLMLKLMKKK